MKIPAIYSDLHKKYVRVFEIWESFSGWYWYVTSYEDPKDQNYCFGLVDGLTKEWGYMEFTSIKEELGKKFWRVHKTDIPYSKNIEMKEQSDVLELKSEYGDFNKVFAN